MPQAVRVYRINYRTMAGEERDEEWASPEAFRRWAETAGLWTSFTVYEEDEDGDWVVVQRGRTGA